MQTYLLGAPITLADVIAILQELKDLSNGSLFFLHLPHLQALATSAGLLSEDIKSLLDKLNILDAQFLADDVQIPDGVDVALDVNDLSIVKAPDNLENGVDGADVRQERVSKTGTGRGTAGETGNIIHSQVGGDLRLGLVVLAQPVEALVGNDDAGLLRINGGIREVRRVAQRALCDGLEESRLSNVCQTNLIQRRRMYQQRTMHRFRK